MAKNLNIDFSGRSRMDVLADKKRKEEEDRRRRQEEEEAEFERLEQQKRDA